LEIIDRGTVPTEFGKALPRAFVQYNHPSHKFNVTYGLFEPRAVLASSRLRFIRIGDYLSNRYGMPPAGNSFSLSPNQRGLELWGHLEGPGGKGGLEWFGGIVNGRDAGIPQGADAYGPQVQQRNERLQLLLDEAGRSDFENNSSKDFYVGANYKFAGMGVLGGSISDITLEPHQVLKDPFLALGFFFYRGKAPALVGEAGHEVLARSGNTFHRLGARLETSFGKTDLLGGVQWNRDRIRGGQGLFTEVISLVEARYTLYPWLIAAVRYENLNPNFGIAFNRTTLHGSILARANVRLALEGVLSRNSQTDPIRDFRRYDSENDSRFRVRLDFSF